MVPCYQLCKDRCCPYWNSELLDCSLLPDDCDYVVEHLVSDRENQRIDGKKHGLWRFWYENGQLKVESNYVDGKGEGFWRRLYKNGRERNEGFYVEGKRHGFWRFWYANGQLRCEGEYVNGEKVGVWSNWDDEGIEIPDSVTFSF